jgi:hypothetical protein
VLTSLDRADLDANLIKPGDIHQITLERAARALQAGADGVIASPQEAAMIRALPEATGQADRHPRRPPRGPPRATRSASPPRRRPSPTAPTTSSSVARSGRRKTPPPPPARSPWQSFRPGSLDSCDLSAQPSPPDECPIKRIGLYKSKYFSQTIRKS